MQNREQISSSLVIFLYLLQSIISFWIGVLAVILVRKFFFTPNYTPGIKDIIWPIMVLVFTGLDLFLRWLLGEHGLESEFSIKIMSIAFGIGVAISYLYLK
ncbi:MAG: hypothetical protein NT135_03515 [Candidatus Berkelbacteria bacterium]|nr:hypothetical protein [Candidatus Berkelbacteria bacterium]